MACWDRTPWLAAVGPKVDQGYTTILAPSGAYSWKGFLIEDGRWANHSQTNCSFFEGNNSLCGTYSWLNASPKRICCACKGGSLIAPSPLAPPSFPPSSPPGPPQSPQPPMPPPSPPSLPPAPPAPCFSFQLDTPEKDAPLMLSDRSDWAAVGFESCAWFDAHVDPAGACRNFTWYTYSPHALCCACGGGTAAAPKPPPSPPTPPPALPSRPTAPASPALPGSALKTHENGAVVAIGIAVPVCTLIVFFLVLLLLHRAGQSWRPPTRDEPSHEHRHNMLLR